MYNWDSVKMPFSCEVGVDRSQSNRLEDRELLQPTEVSEKQNSKYEWSTGVPKVPNFQIGNLHVKIRNDANISPEEEQERPSSPPTPFHDARTSTTENSPQNMQENTNLPNLEQNAEIPKELRNMPQTKDIFNNPSDHEGSIHSFVGNLESEEVLTFPHQLNDQHSSLLSPSEVQQTVGEGGSVIEFEVDNNGKLRIANPAKEISLETLEKLNETIIEKSSMRRYRRTSRISRSTTSQSSSSDNEPTRKVKNVEIKPSQSEVDMHEAEISENAECQETPKKRKRKMSPEEAKLKRKNREEKDAKPCECGGTSAKHRAYYEMNEETTLTKMWCVGSKAATEEKYGLQLFTKAEYNKQKRLLQEYNSEYLTGKMEQNQDSLATLKEETQKGKDKSLSEVDRNFKAPTGSKTKRIKTEKGRQGNEFQE
ncbi:hypothetical protein JTB14_018948 [Gonioctena quinquepunctata]|nr:hypothetical protein JTB14_018948 [Gonioctena quinquepunctata]